MEVSGSGTGKTPNTSLSFRYNANNEEIEELYECDDEVLPSQQEPSSCVRSESSSPKKGDKTSSIIDKYFKSIRSVEKDKDEKPVETKIGDETWTPPKEVSSSPMKDYLNRLGKRSVSEATDVKDVGTNETWKIFHDFKYKIAQAVEDMKTRSQEETKDKEKEKSVARDNSISDSEENSALKDSDLSIGDTDNQVSSLNSSIQNLSELTQPLTAKANEFDSLCDKNSDSSDDTQKNLVHSEAALLTKNVFNDLSIMEVESGVEALEDGLIGIGFNDKKSDITNKNPKSQDSTIQHNVHFCGTPLPSNLNAPPNNSKLNLHKQERQPVHFFTFTLYFLTFLLFINYILFPQYNNWNGFLFGLWVFYVGSTLKQWLLDTYFGDWDATSSTFKLKCGSCSPVAYTIPSVKEHRPVKKYEGWINHYRFPEYDAFTYTINKTTTAYMKLEGCNLRISYTRTKIAKRALWDEKIDKIEFYQHRLYNLTGAKVILLPKGLVKRRQWSKKYPICVILNENEKIQVLEKESAAFERKLFEAEKKREVSHETESAETNTSPEKKKKFVWRRKEKSNSTHTESEPSKEGLRHRLVRKKHKDKKSETVLPTSEAENQSHSDKANQPEETQFHDAETDLATKSNTSTKDDLDEDLDETELTKIKELLEEIEQDTGLESTGEERWSLHVKRSKDNHSRLFLFTRTGRDKHEWFRRLTLAATEGSSPSVENSAAEDKPASEGAETKDSIEMAVYKLSEKETVAFSKSIGSSSLSEAIPITSPAPQLSPYDSYEKTFWPFLLKVIQQQKSQSATCECHTLPAEVSWLNTMIARIIYDVIRNPSVLAKMQARIQKKLHTLKLPSFMSPITVTALSLAGACPLVERVCSPAWDERGVWLDADLRYEGGAYITILTQINLMKLKEKNVTLEEQLMTPSDPLDEHSLASLSPEFTHRCMKYRKAAVYDSDLEDSAESSEDEDSPPIQPVDSNEDVPQSPDTPVQPTEPTAAGSSKKKFLRMVDKIATNKYFQQVTDYKYVKRAMEGLSNTDIKLQVEVHGLEGRLALNLPPPPHDRLWVGFRTNPQLLLKARPAVGARTLRFAHISNWIEQKLSKEFEKLLVLPNMEDIIIDIMAPTPIDIERV